MTGPVVAAFLVHWNAPEWCVESVGTLLASEGVAVYVGVVNNAGSLRLPATVEVVETERNLGFTGGANIGLRRAVEIGAPFVFIGCHDVRLSPTSLKAMVDHLISDPQLGIVGPVINAAGSSESNLDWISGTAMLMRAEVARTLRFDERWGSYVEDVDFCYRARDLGWRVGRTGNAQATTCGSVDEDRATHMMHSNTLVFFIRRRMWRDATKRLVLLLRERRWRTLARGLGRVVVFPFAGGNRGTA